MDPEQPRSHGFLGDADAAGPGPPTLGTALNGCSSGQGKWCLAAYHVSILSLSFFSCKMGLRAERTARRAWDAEMCQHVYAL